MTSALLRLGYLVPLVICVDIDPDVHAAARWHCRRLHAEFPHLFPADALSCGTDFPSDVQLWTPRHTAQLLSRCRAQRLHLLGAAGPPCVATSRAGKQQVRTDSRHLPVRSACIDILFSLRAQLPGRFSWLLECVYCLDNPDAAIQDDLRDLCARVGMYAVVDATQFGASSRRLRLFFTNTAEIGELRAALQFRLWPRSQPPLSSLLEPTHLAPRCYLNDRSPYYRVNVDGEPLRAEYTLCHYVSSHMYSQDGYGLLYDTATASRVRPNSEESGALLSMLPHALDDPALSEETRLAIIGNGIEQRSLLAIFTIGTTLSTLPPAPLPPPEPAPPTSVVHTRPPPQPPPVLPPVPARPVPVRSKIGSTHPVRVSALGRDTRSARGRLRSAQFFRAPAFQPALSLCFLLLLVPPLIFRLGGVVGIDTELPEVIGSPLWPPLSEPAPSLAALLVELLRSPGGAAGAVGIGTLTPEFADRAAALYARYRATLRCVEPFPHDNLDRNLAVTPPTPSDIIPTAAATATDTPSLPDPESFPVGDSSVPDGFEFNVGTDLPAESAAKLQGVLRQKSKAFNWSSETLGRYNGHSGPVGRLGIPDGTAPIFRKQYALSFAEMEACDAHYQGYLKIGRMRPSNSRFACATTVPPKKDDNGNWTALRPCGDYRPINRVTNADHYSLPLIDNILNCLGRSNVFTVCDASKGFNQLPLHPDDVKYTAVWGRNQLYECLYLPFGLRNAPALFQRVMDALIRGMDRTHVYVDDALLHDEVDYSDPTSVDQHISHISEFLDRIIANGLTLNPKKCRFGYSSVEYLGHRLSANSIRPLSDKLDAIHNMPYPTSLVKLQSFLGLCNYYRKHVEHFSQIAKPLTALTAKNAFRPLGAVERAAVDQLKDALCRAGDSSSTYGVLVPPNHDRQFILQTDWSCDGIGAVLSQLDDFGNERVIAYASKTNSAAEASYSSHKGECLAMVWAIRHFHYYLYGSRVPFLLQTDHHSLQWLHTTTAGGQLARWGIILGDYSFEVRHRSGLANANADCLSRLHPPHRAAPDSADSSPVPVSFVGSLAISDIAFPVSPASISALAPLLPALVFSAGIAIHAATAPVDIYNDAVAMHYLRHRIRPDNVSRKDFDRAQHRARAFTFQHGKLYRRLRDGLGGVQYLHVPPPENRDAIVTRIHEHYKHFGIHRTADQVSSSYWWPSLYADVRRIVRACSLCDRNRAGFLMKDPQLHPLPIKGLFYRFGIDLAGPLPKSSRGHVYAMIVIDHFSKFLTLIPLPDKKSETIAYALDLHIFSRFGAPAEVITDQGTEFRGAVDTLLQRYQITHRTTSANHPQADGLAERAVQTMKHTLRRCLNRDNVTDWDTQLPLLSLGYNISRQTSLGFCPYYVVYGRPPGLPHSIVADFASPLQMNPSLEPHLENEDALYSALCHRYACLQRDMPYAAANLHSAQQRDTLRYAETRSGKHIRHHKFFQIGMFAYGRRRAHHTLEHPAADYILRVVNITKDGMLVLQGRCGRTIRANPVNWAPCKLPDIRTTLDPAAVAARIASRDKDQACEWCAVAQCDADADPIRGGVHDIPMLICESCGSAWHLNCVCLTHVPPGHYYCPYCTNSIQQLHLERTPKPVIADFCTYAEGLDPYWDFADSTAPAATFTSCFAATDPELIPDPIRWASHYV